LSLYNNKILSEDNIYIYIYIYIIDLILILKSVKQISKKFRKNIGNRLKKSKSVGAEITI